MTDAEPWRPPHPGSDHGPATAQLAQVVQERGLSAGLLAWFREAQHHGFVGPTDVAEHLTHTERFVDAIGPAFAGRAVDLGTGAGIPGLILAARWPESHWVLVDGKQRRMAPLEAAIEGLGLADRVVVRCERAEETGRRPDLREAFDLVVARSFGPPAATAECAAPLLAIGGRLAVSEPPPSLEPPDAGPSSPPRRSRRWVDEPLLALGLARSASATPHVQVLDKVGPTPEDRPRRVGIPTKRPLF